MTAQTARHEVAIALIDPDPEQPRKHFDEAGIAALAASIEANGLAVPILLRPVGERYVIVHGERRWRAVRSLGWLTIPADVRDMTIDGARWLALVENVQRSDLSPVEEAREYQSRLGQGMTQEQLAARIGKTRTYIAQKIRLLTLPAPLLYFVDHKHLTEHHARQLLRLKAMYPADLARKFDHWTDDKTAGFKFNTADRVFAWGLLREIRPEDSPIWWFGDLLTDKSGPAPTWLSEGCDRFLAEVRAHEYSVPQWMVAAFWWACVAKDLELSVSNLQTTLSGWQERFYSAIAFMTWHAERPSDADKSPQSRLDWLEWWGYWADLRHTGALDWARMTPADDTDAGNDKRIEVFEHVLSQESYMLPSTMQAWGTARQEYEALRVQVDDVYAVLDDVSRDTLGAG